MDYRCDKRIFLEEMAGRWGQDNDFKQRLLRNDGAIIESEMRESTAPGGVARPRRHIFLSPQYAPQYAQHARDYAQLCTRLCTVMQNYARYAHAKCSHRRRESERK